MFVRNKVVAGMRLLSLGPQRLRRRIDNRRLRNSLAGKFHESRALVIASSPRSGSTWLSKLLSATPRFCVLFEPLHLVRVPQAKEAGFGWRTYVDPETDWPEGRAFLERVFTGRVANDWTTREMSLEEVRQADQLIVKFVRLNRLLPWLCSQFEIRPPVLLLRHPCATVASQLRSKDWSTAKRPDAPSFINDFPAFQRALKATSTVEQFLAAAWALDHLPPLMHNRPWPWIVMTYEQLVLNPQKSVERIWKVWGVDAKPGLASSQIQEPSSVTYESGISGVDGWRNQLSSRQVKEILDTVHSFGLTFYGEATEPDLAMLEQGPLGEQIRGVGAR